MTSPGRAHTGGGPAPTGRTLAQKIWSEHVVVPGADAGPDLLYADLHLLHEVTSPQAFDGLRAAGLPVRRPDLTLATEDHNVPTDSLAWPVADPQSQLQLSALRANCAEFGVTCHSLGQPGQGIVHVIGPEQGLSQPGMTIVCGDSHTSTHGAFGALAFGIGSSEVEHVLATQTLRIARPLDLAVTVVGELPVGATAKDLALAVIHELGTNGASGHAIEYRGPAVTALSMEGRLTLCNMTIETGARAGLIAPDQTTFDYVHSRTHAPSGADWDRALADWRSLRSDPDARFDRELRIDAGSISPLVSWGTAPDQVIPVDGAVPDPGLVADAGERDRMRAALEYMGLAAGTRMRDVTVDTVFIGSCTNGRLEDLRAAAAVLAGRRVADGVRALVVPGSMAVRTQAESEGLDRVFAEAGFEWRLPGCSMCTGMNPDRLQSGGRSASTTNRNFEGRQGSGGRTHLVSPAVAAATAVRGAFAMPADLSAEDTRSAAALSSTLPCTGSVDIEMEKR